jgi:hypothetical protein
MNIPTTDYPALIEIINQTYTSGLDAILAAKMVGKNKMLVLGQDGSKQLAVELTPKNIAIKWINSGQKPPKKGAESFGEASLDDALLNAAVVSMAQLVGIDLPISFSEAPILDLDEEYAEGKAFKCSPKSISCKGRCISGWKVCRDGLNAGQIKQLDALMKKSKAGDVDAATALAQIKGFQSDLQNDEMASIDLIGLTPSELFDKAVKQAETMKDLFAKIGVKAKEKYEAEALTKEKLFDDDPDISDEALLASDPDAASTGPGLPKEYYDKKKAIEDEAAAVLKKAKGKDYSQVPEAELKSQAGDLLMTKDIGSWIESKVQKGIKAGMTRPEAEAVATWIGVDKIGYGTWPDSVYTERFKVMNQAIWGKGTPKALPADMQLKAEAVNELAARGYAKLPSITAESVKAKAAKRQIDTGKKSPFDVKTPLSRSVQMSDPAGFVKKYEDAVGKEVTEETNFATTHFKKLNFVEGANVVYKIAPKWDGTGRGKYIDDLKNSASEGEIMFGPGSKFRVKAVIKPEDNPPKPPKGWISDDISDKIDAATKASGLGPEWQEAYKKDHGVKAFNALPKHWKEATTNYAHYVAIDKQHALSLTKNKKAAKPSNYVIELEEV